MNKYKHLAQLTSSVEELNEVLLVPSQEGIMDSFKNLIPTIVNDFVGFIKNSGNIKDQLSLRKGSFDHVVEKAVVAINEYNYMDASLLKAFCPEGFNSYYYDYAISLEKASAFLKDLPRHLDDFELYVAQLLSSSDKVKSTQEALPHFKAFTKQRDLLNKELSKHFKRGSNTEGTFGDFARRNADLSESVSIMNNVNSNLNSIDREQLLSKMNNIAKTLTEIRNKIKEGGYENVSYQTPKDLANTTLQVAMLLEFFSVVYFQAQGMNTALIYTSEHIVNVVNKKR